MMAASTICIFRKLSAVICVVLLLLSFTRTALVLATAVGCPPNEDIAYAYVSKVDVRYAGTGDYELLSVSSWKSDEEFILLSRNALPTRLRYTVLTVSYQGDAKVDPIYSVSSLVHSLCFDHQLGALYLATENLKLKRINQDKTGGFVTDEIEEWPRIESRKGSFCLSDIGTAYFRVRVHYRRDRILAVLPSQHRVVLFDRSNTSKAAVSFAGEYCMVAQDVAYKTPLSVATFSAPHAVTIDEVRDVVYVADQLGLYAIDLNTSMVKLLRRVIDPVLDVYIDSRGNLIVSDAYYLSRLDADAPSCFEKLSEQGGSLVPDFPQRKRLTYVPLPGMIELSPGPRKTLLGIVGTNVIVISCEKCLAPYFSTDACHSRHNLPYSGELTLVTNTGLPLAKTAASILRGELLIGLSGEDSYPTIRLLSPDYYALTCYECGFSESSTTITFDPRRLAFFFAAKYLLVEYKQGFADLLNPVWNPVATKHLPECDYAGPILAIPILAILVEDKRDRVLLPGTVSVIEVFDPSSDSRSVLAGTCGVFNRLQDGFFNVSTFGTLTAAALDKKHDQLFVFDSSFGTLRRLDLSSELTTSFYKGTFLQHEVPEDDALNYLDQIDSMIVDSFGNLLFTDPSRSTLKTLLLSEKCIEIVSILEADKVNAIHFVDSQGELALYMDSDDYGIHHLALREELLYPPIGMVTALEDNTTVESCYLSVFPAYSLASFPDGTLLLGRRGGVTVLKEPCKGLATYIALEDSQTLQKSPVVYLTTVPRERLITAATMELTEISVLTLQVTKKCRVHVGERTEQMYSIAYMEYRDYYFISRYRSSIFTVSRSIFKNSDTAQLSQYIKNNNAVRDGSTKDASVEHPRGFCVDPTYVFVYFVEYDQHLIRKVKYIERTVHTIAGSLKGYMDGDGLRSARFNHPLDISVDGDHNLYVIEWTGAISRLRKVTINADNDNNTTVVTVMRSGQVSRDGPLNTSRLSRFGVAVEVMANGSVALLDGEKVRRIKNTQFAQPVFMRRRQLPPACDHTEFVYDEMSMVGIRHLGIRNPGRAFVFSATGEIRYAQFESQYCNSWTFSRRGLYNYFDECSDDNKTTAAVWDVRNETLLRVTDENVLFAINIASGRLGKGRKVVEKWKVHAQCARYTVNALAMHVPKHLVLGTVGGAHCVIQLNRSPFSQWEVSEVRPLAGKCDCISGYKDGHRSTARFSEPVGVAVDHLRSLVYVTEPHSCRIRTIHLDTSIVGTLFHNCGFENGEAGAFGEPYMLAIDGWDNLLVTDRVHHVLRKVSLSNHCTSTLLGVPGVCGHYDPRIVGTTEMRVTNTTTIQSPSYVTVSPTGDVFVLTESSVTVWKLTPQTHRSPPMTPQPVENVTCSNDQPDQVIRNVTTVGRAKSADFLIRGIAALSDKLILVALASNVVIFYIGGGESEVFAQGQFSMDNIVNALQYDPVRETVLIADENGMLQSLALPLSSNITGDLKPQELMSWQPTLHCSPNTVRSIIVHQVENLILCTVFDGHRVDLINQSDNLRSRLLGSNECVSGYASGNKENTLLDGPYGLAIDYWTFSLYISEYLGHRIRGASVYGGWKTYLVTGSTEGLPGYADGCTFPDNSLFFGPSGLVVTTSRRLLVSDTENQVIRLVEGTSVRTVGGAPGAARYSDSNGSSLDARFSEPTDMLVLPTNGDVIVNERGNVAVRRFQCDICQPAQFFHRQRPVCARGTPKAENVSTVLKFSKRTRSLAVDSGGMLYVAFQDSLVKLGREGKEVWRLSDLEIISVSYYEKRNILYACSLFEPRRLFEFFANDGTLSRTWDWDFFPQSLHVVNSHAWVIGANESGLYYIDVDAERDDRHLLVLCSESGPHDGTLNTARIGLISVVAVDQKNGFIYAVQSSGWFLQRIDLNAGHVTTIFNGPTQSRIYVPILEGPLSEIAISASRLTVDANGDLIFRPLGTCIQKLHLETGCVETLTGMPFVSNSYRDGPASEALVGGVRGLNVDQNGDILFLDGRYDELSLRVVTMNKQWKTPSTTETRSDVSFSKSCLTSQPSDSLSASRSLSDLSHSLSVAVTATRNPTRTKASRSPTESESAPSLSRTPSESVTKEIACDGHWRRKTAAVTLRVSDNDVRKGLNLTVVIEAATSESERVYWFPRKFPNSTHESLSLRVAVKGNHRVQPRGFSSTDAEKLNGSLSMENATHFRLRLLAYPGYQIRINEEVRFSLLPGWFAHCHPVEAVKVATISVHPPAGPVAAAVQMTATVIGGSAIAASSASTTAGAADVQTLAMMGMMTCSNEGGKSKTGSNRALSPVLWNDSPSAMLLSNFALIFFVSIALQLVARVYWFLKTRCLKNKMLVAKALRIMHFPSYVFSCSLMLYPANCFLSTSLIISGFGLSSSTEIYVEENATFTPIYYRPWLQQSLGIIGALYCLIWPLSLTWLSRRAISGEYRQYRSHDEDGKLSDKIGKFWYLILPRGRWEPRNCRMLYGSLYSSYQRSHFLWTLFPYTSSSVISIVAALEPSTAGQCEAQYLAMGVLQFFAGLAVLVLRPYRSWPAIVLSAVSSCTVGVVVLSSWYLSAHPDSVIAESVVSAFTLCTMGITFLRITHSILCHFAERKAKKAGVVTDVVAERVGTVGLPLEEEAAPNEEHNDLEELLMQDEPQEDISNEGGQEPVLSVPEPRMPNSDSDDSDDDMNRSSSSNNEADPEGSMAAMDDLFGDIDFGVPAESFVRSHHEELREEIEVAFDEMRRNAGVPVVEAERQTDENEELF